MFLCNVSMNLLKKQKKGILRANVSQSVAVGAQIFIQ